MLACISSCVKVLLRSCRYLLGEELLSEFWTGTNVFRFPSNINLTNLRLALLDRDFNEADYEMLLALDDQPSTSNQIGRQLSLSELPLLPPKPYRDMGEVKEATCSICLEDFERGQLLRHLSCQHVYHEHCIAKWWKQKGTKTTCPVCKASLF